jgi:hypothetical protein
MQNNALRPNVLIDQIRVGAALYTRARWLVVGSAHVGFMVDKVALGHVFPEFFGLPCQYHSTVTLRTHIYHPGN